MERAARDIFVVSDLHLGDGSVRDKFEAGNKTRRPPRVPRPRGQRRGRALHPRRPLRALADEHEPPPREAAGDPRPPRHAGRHLRPRQPRRRPRPLHRHRLPRPPLLRPHAPPFVRVLGGRRFRFFHGHETDPFNAGQSPGFGRMLADLQRHLRGRERLPAPLERRGRGRRPRAVRRVDADHLEVRHGGARRPREGRRRDEAVARPRPSRRRRTRIGWPSTWPGSRPTSRRASTTSPCSDTPTGRAGLATTTSTAARGSGRRTPSCASRRAETSATSSGRRAARSSTRRPSCSRSRGPAPRRPRRRTPSTPRSRPRRRSFPGRSKPERSASGCSSRARSRSPSAWAR